MTKDNGKKLIILGTATTVFECDYNQENTDYWLCGTAFGQAHSDIKRADMGFEIHPPDQMFKIAQEKKIDYNKFGDIPIMVQKTDNEFIKKLINNPVEFPIDELLEYAKVRLFSCSFTYMFVYACMLGYKDISFYKILLASGGEYFLERPGLEYWIEKMIDKEGLKVFFPEDAELFSGNYLYGYEQRPNIYKMQSFKRHLWEQLHNEFHFVENSTAQVNKNLGAMEMFNLMNSGKKEDEIKAILEKCNLMVQDGIGKSKEHKEKYLQYFGGLQTAEFLEDRGL